MMPGAISPRFFNDLICVTGSFESNSVFRRFEKITWAIHWTIVIFRIRTATAKPVLRNYAGESLSSSLDGVAERFVQKLDLTGWGRPDDLRGARLKERGEWEQEHWKVESWTWLEWKMKRNWMRTKLEGDVEACFATAELRRKENVTSAEWVER